MQKQPRHQDWKEKVKQAAQKLWKIQGRGNVDIISFAEEDCDIGMIGYVTAVKEAWGGEEGETEAWDDVSGKSLDPEMVKEARREEMAEFRQHNVYAKVSIEERLNVTGNKPVQVKWVDINKGDSEHPEYRSRLVAKEIKRDTRDDLFAATPPIEALTMMLGMARTEGI